MAASALQQRLGVRLATGGLAASQQRNAHVATVAAAAAPSPRGSAAAAAPGRRLVAARAATQMRPLPSLAGGLTSLRDIKIDMSEDDMSSLELRDVKVG